jgi:hypothetical protein
LPSERQPVAELVHCKASLEQQLADASSQVTRLAGGMSFQSLILVHRVVYKAVEMG